MMRNSSRGRQVACLLFFSAATACSNVVEPKGSVLVRLLSYDTRMEFGQIRVAARYELTNPSDVPLIYDPCASPIERFEAGSFRGWWGKSCMTIIELVVHPGATIADSIVVEFPPTPQSPDPSFSGRVEGTYRVRVSVRDPSGLELPLTQRISGLFELEDPVR